jgi:protein-disulfide isomerase
MSAARQLLGLAVALLLAGCRGESKPDPQLPALPGVDAIDDSLSAVVREDGQTRVAVPLVPGDAGKGAAEPLVTIVEWSDFQCPHCSSYAQMLDEVAASYPDDVRVVFRQYPLPMHPDAELGARAAVAAAAQGRFWAMHDRLFANRSAMGRDEVVAHARALGLDVAAFEAALDDPATAAKVQADKRAGAELGIRGTPSGFVNGIAFSGAPKPEALTEMIERERALGRRLIEAGSTRAQVYARIVKAAGGR